MADQDEQGDGDMEQELPDKPSPPPPPPKVPDVELIVDGFGFMPKDLNIQRGKDPTTKVA